MLTFIVAVFLLLMQKIFVYIDDFVGKGLSLAVIGEVIFYASVTLVPMALPLAILLSSLMTFGNLGEHYELVALKSSGVSLGKTMKPLIVLTFLISIAAFFFANNILPIANLKMTSLLVSVREKKPELNLKEGIFFSGLENYSIKIGQKDKETGMMKDVLIYDHTDPTANRIVTFAKEGKIEYSPDKRYLFFTLFNGYRYEEVAERNVHRRERHYPMQREKFAKQTVVISLSGFQFERNDESIYNGNYSMLNIDQLEYSIDSLENAFTDRHDVFSRNLFKINYLKKIKKTTSNSSKVKKIIKEEVVEQKEPKKKDSSAVSKKNTNPLFNADILKSRYSDKLTSKTIIKEKKGISLDSMLQNIENPLVLFDTLSGAKKLRAADLASSYARSTHSYIESTKNELKYKRRWINRFLIEWHRKFTIAFSCMVLFFIGAPLGAIIRKGGLGLPVVISVVFFILYYVVTISTEKSVREGVTSPVVGMWIATYVLLPLGIFLTYKANNEASMMNSETYTNFVKKLFRKKKAKRENITINK